MSLSLSFTHIRLLAQQVGTARSLSRSFSLSRSLSLSHTQSHSHTHTSQPGKWGRTHHPLPTSTRRELVPFQINIEPFASNGLKFCLIFHAWYQLVCCDLPIAISISLCLYIFVMVYACVCMCTCTYMCMCMYICIYVYVYIYFTPGTSWSAVICSLQYPYHHICVYL